ncbi:MAG TPA: carboxymuconolactone decarboxylase family protein [Tepidiformaceae bacterium]|nr:carboxymuconolactone decarboxylase family protein [Tepidiformaceae bacterium]
MTRIKLYEAFQEGLQAMGGVGTAVHDSGLEPSLLELVDARASQINGCAFCLNMHVAGALKHGENEMRLLVLPAWRETTWFTHRERAALALTEAMTLIADDHVPDDVWEAAAEEFEERELAALMLAICQINAWNRLQIATEAPPHLE